MESPEAVSCLRQLLAPITSGPDADAIERRLRQLLGSRAVENPEGLSLDDWLNGRRACLLCITPRSGSTYLAALMRGTGRLGLAAEFMNSSNGAASAAATYREVNGCDPMGRIAKEHHLRSVAEYLRHIIGHFSSPDGVFSMKGDLFHYLPLIQNGLIRRGLQKVTFVYVTREDLVAQAVSLFRAVQTRKWSSLHQVQGKAQFDAAAILSQLGYLVQMMSRWEMLFALLGVQPIRLTYEQITATPAAVVRDLAGGMGLAVNVAVQKCPLARQRDRESAEWVQRIISVAGASGDIWRGIQEQSNASGKAKRNFREALRRVLTKNIFPVRGSADPAPG